MYQLFSLIHSATKTYALKSVSMMMGDPRLKRMEMGRSLCLSLNMYAALTSKWVLLCQVSPKVSLVHRVYVRTVLSVCLLCVLPSRFPSFSFPFRCKWRGTKCARKNGDSTSETFFSYLRHKLSQSQATAFNSKSGDLWSRYLSFTELNESDISSRTSL